MSDPRFRFILTTLAFTTCVSAVPRSSAAQVTVGWNATGPVRYGMEVDELEAVLGRELVDSTGRGSDACDQVTIQVDGQPLGVMIVGTSVVRVDVRAAGIRTEAGAGVGDSPQYVMARYREHVASPNPTNDGQILTVLPADGVDEDVRLVFETLVGQVMAYRAGRLPAVSWIGGCSGR